MRCLFRSIAALILLPAIAVAQTTQPAMDATWAQQFAASSVDGSVTPPAGFTCSRFEKNQSQTVDDLRAAIGDRKLMVCQTYIGVPQTLASDIASALHDQPVSDSVKRLFTPRTADALKHADEVSTSWVQSVMKPKPADAVGVLLFCADSSSANDHPSDLVIKPAGPLMVLIDAEPAGVSGPRIHRVLFGDPRGQ